MLVITGVGPVFSAGGDVKDDLPKFTATPYFLADRSPRAGGHRSFVFQLQNFEKPTIAALNGVAAGGGFSLALACDLRIASETARLAPIFSRIGLAPDTGHVVPAAAARRPGQGARDQLHRRHHRRGGGAADRPGQPGGAAPRTSSSATNELAQKIAAGPPLALKLTKRLLYHGAEADLEAAYDMEGYLQGICLQSADFQEGIAAFAEKRQPALHRQVAVPRRGEPMSTTTSGGNALVSVEIDGPVATLTLNRPERLNALTAEMVDELVAALADIEQRPEVRADHRSPGPGRGFCAGADVVSGGRQLPIEGRYTFFNVLEDHPKPTIAAIHGACIGGGLELALCCDLRVAAD